MGAHSLSIRRGGRGRKVALAALGAATVGVVSIAGLGVASAAPAPLPLPPIPGLEFLQPSGTTEVNEDLAPFTETDTRPDGSVEVNEDFGAPTGGGTGSLRLDTPSDAAKATAFAPDDSPLSDWVGVAAYSAFRSEDSTANEILFPSLQLVIDFNGDAEGGFSALTYEPVYNEEFDASLVAGQWNRYEAGDQGWCSTRVIPGVFDEGENQCSNGGVLLLEDISEALPDAVVTSFGVNQGSGNPGLSSAVDLITTPETTFDFEVAGPVVMPPAPGDDDDHGDDGKDDDGKDEHGHDGKDGKDGSHHGK